MFLSLPFKSLGGNHRRHHEKHGASHAPTDYPHNPQTLVFIAHCSISCLVGCGACAPLTPLLYHIPWECARGFVKKVELFFGGYRHGLIRGGTGGNPSEDDRLAPCRLAFRHPVHHRLCVPPKPRCQREILVSHHFTQPPHSLALPFV